MKQQCKDPGDWTVKVLIWQLMSNLSDFWFCFKKGTTASPSPAKTSTSHIARSTTTAILTRSRIEIVQHCIGRRGAHIVWASSAFAWIIINSHIIPHNKRFKTSTIRDLKSKSIFAGSKLLSGRPQRPGWRQTVRFLISCLSLSFLIFRPALKLPMLPGMCGKRSPGITTMWWVSSSYYHRHLQLSSWSFLACHHYDDKWSDKHWSAWIPSGREQAHVARRPWGHSGDDTGHHQQ